MESILSIDKPISKSSDDFLGRKYFADIITKATIGHQDSNQDSLTIGLYGKWGSGKTSIINMVIENLEKEENIIVFNFKPWLYSDTQQLLSQFFIDFSAAIKKRDYGQEVEKLGQDLEVYSTFFDVISWIPHPATSLISSLLARILASVGKSSSKWGKQRSKNLSATKDSIEEHLKRLNKKIVIIIDDIDRLNNTEIRQIFQLIKSLGDFPNTIYITSMDREVVIDALSAVQKGDGNEYLEKIIHVPLNVPSISNEKVHDFLFNKLNEILLNVDDKDFDQNYWGNVYHSGFKHFFNNIRDVIRYINILKFNFSAIGKDVNMVDLIAITGFQVFEPKIYDLIRNNPDMFKGSGSTGSHPGDSKEVEIKEFFEKSYQKLVRLKEDEYLSLMQEIFLKIKEIYTNTTYSGGLRECRREGKLCSPDFFDIYFKITLDESSISKRDMQEYINKSSDENDFKKLIISLNDSNNIYHFLDRLTDYIDDIDEEKTRVICNVLFDLGDTFPETTGMFSLRRNSRVRLLISRLLYKQEQKEKRYIILKESIERAENSIDISLSIISFLMQQHGEYHQEAIDESEQIVTNTQLQELKTLFRGMIEKWVEKYGFLNSRITLNLLYLWKKIDEETVASYVDAIRADDDKIISFLEKFNSVTYYHTSEDYTEREKREFKYKYVKDFIDPESIIEKIRGKYNIINSLDISEDLKFSIRMFVDYYDGKIPEDEYY